MIYGIWNKARFSEQKQNGQEKEYCTSQALLDSKTCYLGRGLNELFKKTNMFNVWIMTCAKLLLCIKNDATSKQPSAHAYLVVMGGGGTCCLFSLFFINQSITPSSHSISSYYPIILQCFLTTKYLSVFIFCVINN